MIRASNPDCIPGIVKTAVECENLRCERADWNGHGPAAVRGISTSVAQGELVGFCGPDGCGKGLLLNLLGLLDRPDAGRIRIADEDTAGMDEEDAAFFRNEAFGYLFGHPYLLPSFSVAENVAMPLFRIRGADAKDARTRTLEVLEFAGIPGCETPLAGRLSSEVRWRAAFARAIVHEPAVLIAISPPQRAGLLPLARKAADELGLAVLWAGSREELAPFANRVLDVCDGRLA